MTHRWVASFLWLLRLLSCSAQARIVEIRQEVDRLLDQCTETHKACRFADYLPLSRTR